MYFRFNFIKFFQERRHRSSIYGIVFLSLFFLSAAGCSDSNHAVKPLTDTERVYFQDGDGQWVILDETEFMATGIFTPTVTDSLGRYSIAVLFVDAEEQEVSVTTLQATTAELPQIDFSAMLEEDEGTASLTVNLGEPSLADSDVNIFFYDDSWFSYSGTSHTYSNLWAGDYDLVLTQTESANRYPTTLLARRDLELVADETLVQEVTTSDLAGSVTLTGPYTVTVRDRATGNPIDSGIYGGDIELLTTNLTTVDLGEKYDSDSVFEYTALGTPLTAADTYLIDLGIEIGDNHEFYYYEVFQNEGDIDISLPVDDFGQTFSANTSTGSLLPGMTIPDIDIEEVTVIGYSVYFMGNINGIEYTSRCLISAARQTGTSFTMPDLSSAEEWEDHWSIPTDIEIERTMVEAYIGSDNFLDQSSLISYFSSIEPRELYQQMEDGDWVAILQENIYYGAPL